MTCLFTRSVVLFSLVELLFFVYLILHFFILFSLSIIKVRKFITIYFSNLSYFLLKVPKLDDFDVLCGAVNEGSCHWCLVVGYIHHYFEFMHCFYKWHGGGFVENSNIHVAEFVRFSCKFKKLLKEIFKWNSTLIGCLKFYN